MKSKSFKDYFPYLVGSLLFGFAQVGYVQAAAQIVTTDCVHTEEGSKCTLNYTFSSGESRSSSISFDRIYYQQLTPEIRLRSANPYPNEISTPELEKYLALLYDKTPWDHETKADMPQLLMQTKNLINYLILKKNLSPEYLALLNKSLVQVNNLIGNLSAAGQITNHLINQEWGYAGSELATLLASIAITTGASVVAGIVILPKIEKFLNNIVDNYDHDRLLSNMNNFYRLDKIYEIPRDISFNIMCELLPPHKRRLLEFCMIPPIVIDLDGNGVAFVPLSASRVQLDVNDDGLLDTISWPTHGNAVLFADWNKSGILDSRSEFMFGLFSTNKNASDLEGLQLFDYDEDGDMDSDDRIYPSLFLWEDRNSDGICTSDEVVSLAERNMVLNFTSSRVLGETVQGNVLQYKFSYRMQYRAQDGRETLVSAGQAYSVLLQAKLH